MTLPKYTNWDSVPKHLMTKTSLEKEGLTANGLKPVALKKGKYDTYYLYDSTQAKPKQKRTLSEKQLTALAKGRQKRYTCPICKEIKTYVIQNLKIHGQMCYDCLDRIITDNFINARIESQTWAREVLNDQAAIILDTETTGLSGVVIQIAIINMAGEVLLNTLVKNLEPIEPGAQAVHGLSENDLAQAPTWAETWPQVLQIFNQATQLIVYNVSFDRQIIRNTNELAEIKAKLNGYTWQCAMEIYAQWYGEWSDYYNSYKWQPLNGGHDALGDCYACLDLIKEMSKDTPHD